MAGFTRADAEHRRRTQTFWSAEIPLCFPTAAFAPPPFPRARMKKHLVEFIGPFFLIFTIGCTVIPPNVGALAPLARGASLMVMIFAGGHVSGGHFNPAGSARPMGWKAALLGKSRFTVALTWVVLNPATAKGPAGNSFSGLAIGMTFLTGAFAVGSVSGGAFKPAVASGPTFMGLSTQANLWIFLGGNFAGGAGAAITCKLVHGHG